MRELSEPVTMDDLEDLDVVKADPLYDILSDAGIQTDTLWWIFNNLINQKEEAEGTSMQAKTLARHPEPAGSTITFRGLDRKMVSGTFERALESGNGDVAIAVSGNFHVVPGNHTVKVWAPKTEKPKAKVTNSLGRDPIHWTEYQAEFFWMNRDWITDGREVQFQDGFVQVGGKITDAWLVAQDRLEKIFLVVDGKIYPVRRDFKVKVYTPRIGGPCPKTWTNDWDRSAPYWKCEMHAGHTGRCGRK